MTSVATNPRLHRRLLGLALPPALHAAASALLIWASSGTAAAVRAPGPARLEDLLTLAAVAAAWCVLTWLTAGLLLAVLGSLRDGAALARLAAAVAPRGARRVAALLLGLSLAGAPLSAAHADGRGTVTAVVLAATGAPTSGSTAAPPGTPPAALAGWTPDRPAAPATRQPGKEGGAPVTPAHRHPAAAEAVVVRRGDTLWAIAAAHLGPAASLAEVAAEWPRWYAANRATVGPDPDLIRPGQRLRPPPR